MRSLTGAKRSAKFSCGGSVILKPDDTDIKKKSNFPYCSNELRSEHGVDN